MADGKELKDELAVLGQHMQRFFVADRRPWAEVRVQFAVYSLSAAGCCVWCVCAADTRVRRAREL